jgi:hypothetical protein
MKINRLYRGLRKLGVSKWILTPLFRNTRVIIVLPDSGNEGDGRRKGLKLAGSLIRRGYRVSLEDCSCRRARYTLWLWEEHSRFVNGQVKRLKARTKN